MGFIYILENKINGKCYVGQTSQKNVWKRINSHRNRQESAIYYAIKKYGFDNFNKYIFECDECDLDYFETMFIKQMNTLVKNGYNRDTGGTSNKHPSIESRNKMSITRTGEKNHFYGKKHKPETIEKIRNSNLGKKRSKEFCKQNSEVHTGLQAKEKHPLWGKHHSEETKKKIGEKSKGRKTFLGKQHTEESLAKMRGRKQTEEAKQKMRDAWKIRKQKKDIDNGFTEFAE